jgi:hypothetical protein
MFLGRRKEPKQEIQSRLMSPYTQGKKKQGWKIIIVK